MTVVEASCFNYHLTRNALKVRQDCRNKLTSIFNFQLTSIFKMKHFWGMPY